MHVNCGICACHCHLSSRAFIILVPGSNWYNLENELGRQYDDVAVCSVLNGCKAYRIPIVESYFQYDGLTRLKMCHLSIGIHSYAHSYMYCLTVTHTHARAHIHSQAHTHTHTHTRTHTHMCTHTHTRMRAHSHVHARIHTLSNARAHTHVVPQS